MKPKKIKKMKKKLLEYEEKYYEGIPIIEDEEYDFKLRKLQTIDPLQPSNQVNKPFLEEYAHNFKYRHTHPMLSLNNAFNYEELDHFFLSHKKVISEVEGGFDHHPEYFLEPKIDGVSLSLKYVKGKLIEALSRGDGYKGDQLIEVIQEIKCIPKNIDYTGEIIIRGELYINLDNFISLQEIYRSKGEKIPSNPRNYLSGILRLKKVNPEKYSIIEFIGYQLFFNGSDPSDYIPVIKTQKEGIQFIRDLNIPTHNAELTLCSSSRDKIFKFLSFFENFRKNWTNPSDGVVLKLNDFKYYESIGTTSKFPKWAIAFKYPSLIKNTKLLQITASVGRSGRITYLGRLNPIEIGGTKIQWVSLHNFENVRDLNLREGSIVQVYKSGEVIPQISLSLDNSHLPPFEPITHCPSCSSVLVFREIQGKIQYCTNADCEDQIILKISYFCSKNGVDILGLSRAIISKLYRENLVREIPDLYYLHQKRKNIYSSKILNIKDKLFNKLISSIENSKSSSPHKFLNALGIEYVGLETSKLLLGHFQTLDNLFSSSIEEKLNIPGIGPKSAYSIHNWIQEKNNLILISKLKNIGFNSIFSDSFRNSSHKEKSSNNTYNSPKYMDKYSYLVGKQVSITGILPISRSQFQEYLNRNYDVAFSESITKKVDFLIVGEAPGSKLIQAKKLGIRVLKFSEIKEILGYSDSGSYGSKIDKS